ncbi:chemotaxis protein CheB [Solilutibacter silvestris]|uniref:protein-glutamate methylesterase n=1 Tax=Solilutibacter silvestris TaxID=1645665 RepID=A0A2K1PXH2_9GAMM|nr:chemotaxis protein CheB [Lysobacter silvestris]PNS07484.1 CheB methylesterase [Lysobacter silvestris]
MADRRATVVLGRPGELRDRLEAALREAGAEIALVVDPMSGDAAQVQALAPRNVVVLMEPGVEEALDARFDALFDDPGIELLFEESSVLASRQGWDLARWGRHLSAKLHGSHDVLPAGHDDDAGFVAPLPRDALKPKAEQAATPEAQEPAVHMHVQEESSVLQQEEQEQAEPVVPAIDAGVETATPLAVESAVTPMIALDEMMVESPVQPPSAPGLEGHHWSPEQPAAAGQPEVDWNSHPAGESDANDGLDYLEPVKMVPRGGGEHHYEAFDPAVFIDAAHHLPDAEPIQLERLEPLEPMDHADHGDVIGMEQVPPPVANAQPVMLASAASMDAPDMTPSALHETWSLVDEDHGTAAAPSSQQSPLAPVSQRLDGMSMVDDGTVGLEAGDDDRAPASTLSIIGSHGAVLIVAGVGGPDPLRALLGQLPENFPRPILIQQHLDAGNYDRLARQMERATRLKVKLATAGMAVEGNTVYVLPVSLGLDETAGGLAFVDVPQARGFADVTSRLDPADSALLVLSGAPTDFIEEALRFKVAGAWVAAQAEHGCFDHAVPALVAARGAEIAEPLALAQKLNARWHA